MLRILILFLMFATVSLADGLRDNNPETVRQVPPLGVEVPQDIKADLSLQINAIQVQVAAIRSGNNKQAIRLLPDVEIFSRAVQQAIDHREFFSNMNSITLASYSGKDFVVPLP